MISTPDFARHTICRRHHAVRRPSWIAPRGVRRRDRHTQKRDDEFLRQFIGVTTVRHIQQINVLDRDLRRT
jgi:hypothetical protein